MMRSLGRGQGLRGLGSFGEVIIELGSYGIFEYFVDYWGVDGSCARLFVI